MGFIESGTYYMGSPDTEEDRDINEMQRLVTMRPFHIGKYEVTQKEYQEVMGKNPSYFLGDNLPVENVSWFDAIEYCNALSRREGLPVAYTITGTGNNRIVTWDQDSLGYRLPTEAEWEYACRAGTRTPYNTGNSINNRNQANYFSNGTRNVGSYPPNNWGLYDMHGNVAEWCWDLYSNYNASLDNENNPAENHRVFRGGSWFNLTMRLRSAFRDHYFPNYRTVSIGFRVVRTIP
jgi:formylglycine-generating enzyme required for sulfatase activity